MNNLSVRQVKFIKLLLAENEYKSINYFATFLEASCKTLQKDLKVIENYLVNFNVVLSKKRGTGIKIINVKAARWLLLNNLEIQEKKCEKITLNERRLKITRDLLVNSNDITSIQRLSDEYYVSKTSIVADLEHIEKWLKHFDLTMKKNVKGTKLVGTEVNIRKALSLLMTEYYKLYYKDNAVFQDITSRIDSSTFNALLKLFDKDKIIYVNKYLMTLEKKYDCVINDPYYINLLTHILISLTRGLAGEQINKNLEPKDVCNLEHGIPYEEALNMINKMNADFKIKLGASEVYYLYEYFSSCGLMKNEAVDEDVISDKLNGMAKIFTRKLTHYVENIININISDDKEIMKNIFFHVGSMLNRLKYDIQITNPLLESIKNECPDIVEICKTAALFTSHDLGKKIIPTDEVSYLAVYYQTALERLPIKKRVIIVCQSGSGTSQLLATRVKKVFPQWDIVDIVSIHNLKECNLSSIDFVISTIPIKKIEKPYIVVSVFLNNEDIKNILNINVLARKPLKSNYVKLGMRCINKYLYRSDIYFNKSDCEMTKTLNKECNSEIVFNDICFGSEIIIKLGFTENQIMAVNIKDDADIGKQAIFYVAMNNTNIMAAIMSSIYYFYKFHYKDEHILTFINNCIDNSYVNNYKKKDNKTNNRTCRLRIAETDIKNVIKRETIKFGMNARNKEEALFELSELLKKQNIILNMDNFLIDLNKRESLGITGIGNGIALPHAKSEFIKETVVAIGKTKEPIQWNSLDNKPVNFIILFAVKDGDKTNKVHSISKIASMLGDDEICRNLLLTQRPDDIYRVFSE